MAIVGRVLKGAAWSGIGRMAQAVISIITLGILARLVGPEAFGVQALALVVVGFVEMLTIRALADPIIQYKDASARRLDSVAWTIIILTVAIAGLIWLGAGAIGGALGSPTIAAILPWSALALPIAAIGAVPVAILLREVRTKALTGIDALAQIGSAAVGIALAANGAGVMSLVVMELVRQGLRSAGAVWASRYLPGRHAALAEARSLLPSNAVTLGMYLAGFADRAGPRALIGVVLGEAALGLYVVAFRLYDQLAAIIVHPMSTVALPAVVAAKDDPRELERLIEGGFRLSTALSFPVFIGFACVTPLAVPLLLGQQWQEAALPAALLALIGLRSATGIFTVAILRATGRSLQAMLMIALGALVSTVGVALAAPYGIAAATAAILLRTYLTWPLGIVLVSRATGVSVARQLATMRESGLAALVMAAVVLALMAAMGDALAPGIVLAIAVAVGAAVYVGALATLRRDYVRLALKLVQTLRGRLGATT